MKNVILNVIFCLKLMVILILGIIFSIGLSYCIKHYEKPKQIQISNNELYGKVVGISDGDTITILDSNQEQHKIRLAEIDAPEKKQDYGTKSKKALADKIFDKNIKVIFKNKDRYGRIVGEIYLDDRWINKEMIEEGWAWHYITYSKSKELADCQDHAKKHKIGLWKDENPTPPWQFRKNY